MRSRGIKRDHHGHVMVWWVAEKPKISHRKLVSTQRDPVVTRYISLFMHLDRTICISYIGSMRYTLGTVLGGAYDRKFYFSDMQGRPVCGPVGSVREYELNTQNPLRKRRPAMTSAWVRELDNLHEFENFSFPREAAVCISWSWKSTVRTAADTIRLIALILLKWCKGWPKSLMVVRYRTCTNNYGLCW